MQMLFNGFVILWLIALTVSRIAHQRDENRRFDRMNARVDREERFRGQLRQELNAKLHKQRRRLFALDAKINGNAL